MDHRSLSISSESDQTFSLFPYVDAIKNLLCENQRDIVFFQSCIMCYKSQPFEFCLCDQHPVERITMMHGKPA